MFIFFKRKFKSAYKKINEAFFFLLYKKPKLKLKVKDFSEKIFDIKIDKNLYKAI